MIHRVFFDYQPQGNQSPRKLRPSSNPSPATTYKRRLGLTVLRSSDNKKDVMKVAMMILLAAVTVTILVTRPADAVSCTMNNCLTCDNAPLQCGRCTPGEVLSDDSKSCLDCPANCRLCTVDGEETKCAQCYDGYMIDADGACTACPSDCKTCEKDGETTKCTECFEYRSGRYYIMSAKATCLPCGSNCEACTEKEDEKTVCTKCINKYVLKSSDKTCSACSPHCDVCSKCSGNKVNEHAKCEACVDNGLGNYPKDGECTTCTDNCFSCSSDSECSKCKPKFYLNDGSCEACGDQCKECQVTDGVETCKECAAAYGPKASPTCDACVEHCKTDDAGVCTACEDGYYLDGLICSPCGSHCTCSAADDKCEDCVEGYALDGTSCKRKWSF
ncbi:hypothetical protein LSAT2_012092 [Lamellibrachia satsuma]|nr:hypothetical protein LSAT2_012092 [Lamellibrachia satsuma]